MPTYGFQATTKRGVRLLRRDIDCENDDAARHLAGEMLPGYASIEVWSSDKLVSSL